jgi:N utilization substance protein B
MWEQGSPEDDLPAVAARTLARRRVSDRYRVYLSALLEILAESLPEIDATLREHLSNWRLERLSAIDRGILRIGAGELLYRDDVPSAVAIHEAIQLAQRYGSAESGKFVNGVLDAVARAVRGTDGE